MNQDLEFGIANLNISNERKIEGDEHEGWISEISSPTRFYIQFAKQVEETDWEAKQVRWNWFYIDYGNNVKSALEEADVIVGDLICARALGRYDRAVILSRLTEAKTIKVFFIDHGTVGNVKLQNCHKLEDEWKENVLPRIAHRALLHGVQPIGGKTLWPSNTTYTFIDNVRDNRVSIEILNYIENTRTYEVNIKLKDVRKTDLYKFMTDYRLGENYPSLIEDNAQEKRKKSKCLIYPSFDVLETSFYPTLGERDILWRRQNIDFNEYEEDYIDHNITKFDTLNDFRRQIEDQVYLNGLEFLLRKTV